MTGRHAHGRGRRGDRPGGALAAVLAGAAVLATPLLVSGAPGAPAEASPGRAGQVQATTVDPSRARIGPVWRAELPDACTPEEIPTEPSPVLPALGVEEAWELSRGEGVTVAVVDSGVAPSEPHLPADEAVLPGLDSMGTVPGSETVTEGPPLSSSDGRTDFHFHGTAAASLIAARDPEGTHVVGLAPEAQILPVRVYVTTEDDELIEAGYGTDVGRMAEGIRWAADQGAQIISVSMSLPTDVPELREAVEHASAAGSLVVASAGNARTADDDTPGPRYPAAYPGALAVTATTIEGEATDDSIPGEHVEIAAPGDPAYYAYVTGEECYTGGGGEAASSWATAYVAASAALVASMYPDETPAQWAHRLMVTAVRTVPGERDDLLGWGSVAPYDALSFVDDGAAPGPPSPVHEAPSVDAPTFVAVPERPEDPLEAVRGTAAWWVFGAFVVVGGAGLLAKAPRRRG
ncbi:S8 family serine peptidase [Georgenia sp. Z1491]|uniref:S8 family serine peptidase n=1 Tax=Georgenia sp. Z1491 TaxID=3416707 RepID=UPI003CF2ACF0